MRRSIPALTAALGLVMALGACSSSDNNEGDAPETSSPTAAATPTEKADAGSLTIWVDETRQAAVQAAAKTFEDETGATVNLVLKNFDDIRADFTAQVPTGEGPDITVGAHDWLGEFTANGVVAPLELGDQAADFAPISISAFTQDGQVYGLPYAIENIALIRNVDLAPQAPATWDDALAAGKAAGTEFPILIQTGEKGDPYTYYPLQTSFGAPVFEQNADGTYKPTLAMGGEKGEAFASWLAAQGKAGVLDTAVTYDIAVDAFNQGKSPFIIGGPWMLGSFTDVPNISIDPIPSAGGQPALPFVGVQGFYLSAQSKNALLASDFLLNYMATESAQTALYEAGNRLPALTAAADKAKADPVTAGFAAIGVDAVPMPSIPAMGAVWTYWGVTQASIITGQAEPVAAWQKMISDIQGTLDS